MLFLNNALLIPHREEFLSALRKQRAFYEMAEGNREQALALKDLLLLSLYILFPPSRALEVRTLRIFLESGDQQFTK